MKMAKECQKFIKSILGAFAIIVGASTASSATAMLIHQPQCPKHLVK